MEGLTRPGRSLFAIGMALGILNFIYADSVSGLEPVPTWVPGCLCWVYFAGAAFVAAGLSIVTKVKARLAATLLGVMFGAWVLILHAPRVAAKLRDREEWTCLLVATAMCWGACLVAGSLAREDSTK